MDTKTALATGGAFWWTVGLITLLVARPWRILGKL